MKCTIVKWIISSARNRGRSLRGPARRHLERCASCREFARFTLALSETASRDGRAYLEKIPAPETAGVLERFPAKSGPSLSPRRPVKRLWIPASVAAAGLVLIAFLVFRPSPLPREINWQQEIEGLKKLPFSGGAIVNLAAEAESPLDREYESLKKAADSAVRAILARLDFKIGDENRPARAGRTTA